MERQEPVVGPNKGNIMKTTIKTLAAAALVTLSVSAIAQPATLKGEYVVCDSQVNLGNYLIYEDAGDTARMEILLMNGKHCRFWHKGRRVTRIGEPQIVHPGVLAGIVKIELHRREMWTVEEELELLK